VRTTVLCATAVPLDVEAELSSLGISVVEHALSGRDSAWMRDFVAETMPDVIVSHSPRETISLLRWNLGRRTPLVVVAHHGVVSDDPRLRRLKELAFRALNHRASLHIAVSTTAATGAQCAGARRTELHPLGAELDAESQTISIWPTATRVRLMTLSRLIWFKNITALVEAVALTAGSLRAAGAHLAIVGSGPMREEIATAIARLEIGDLVTMHDYVPHPGGLLAEADALVSCATSEGGPLTVFEASLAGARVLSTPTGVAPEVLATDPGSVITSGSAPSDLAEGLTRILELGALRPEERAVRAGAAAKWSSENRAPRFYELVASALPRSEP
ncbi:MAG: glycosyltransferase, partial [bacterium]|nr:glycosyltransferase [bacterium]